MTDDSKSERTPVLIIPGFMSSGLVCKKSGVGKKFEGKRIWINVPQLGFHSLHSDGALVANEKKRKERGGGLDVTSSPFSQTLHAEYVKAERCKSAWLQHMALEYDMCTERTGTQLRAIPGLEGVEFLTDSIVTQLTSYVFGPVTAALRKMGYTRGVDLDAAPYDWRLPPSVTEERDAYLTSTISRIEKMYRDNKNKPIALLCHSLGCKMGHYMLNHCLKVKGQAWIDKYIHTFVCIGAPHLGVSKALRGLINGDKMALDAFFSDEEGLILGRSLGSCPWMLPTKLPAEISAAIPNAICRKEASISISLSPSCLHVKPLIHKRLRPLRLRLCVQYGQQVLYTDFKKYAHKMTFDETFCFAAPPTLNHPDRVDNINNDNGSLESLVIFLQEPGTHSAKSRDMPSCTECIGELLYRPIRRSLCCPFSLLGFAAKTTASAVAGGVMGAGTSIATSPDVDVKKVLKKTTTTRPFEEEGDDSYTRRVVVELTAQADIEHPVLFRGRRRFVQTTAQIQWIQPPPASTTSANGGEDVHLESSLALLPDCDDSKQQNNADSNESHLSFEPSLQVKDPENAQAEFEPASGHALIQAEGMDARILQLLKTRYEKDPLGPRTKSSDDAPPVKRIMAIYGINCPTEVSGIYRRRPGRVILKQQDQDSFSACHTDATAAGGSTYILDTEARLDHVAGMASKSYKVSGGIFYETKDTPQVVNNMNNSTSGEKIATVRKSGDGTIPYWSLQHCRSWASPTCNVKVHEIDGADHRDILKDRRLYEILGNYLIKKKSK